MVCGHGAVPLLKPTVCCLSLYLSVSLPASVCTFIQPPCWAVHVSKEPDLPWLLFLGVLSTGTAGWYVERWWDSERDRLTVRETEKEKTYYFIGNKVKRFPVVWSYCFKEMYHSIASEQWFRNVSKVWRICQKSISQILYTLIFVNVI